MKRCTRYNIKFFSDLRLVGGFPLCTPVSPTNKTDRHNITEILLKVALNTSKSITLVFPYMYKKSKKTSRFKIMFYLIRFFFYTGIMLHNANNYMLHALFTDKSFKCKLLIFCFYQMRYMLSDVNLSISTV